MKMTIINIVLGCFFGVVGKIVYDKIQRISEKNRISDLLIVEMKSNLKNLNSLLEDIETIRTNPNKEYLQSFTLEETADVIQKLCKREHFNKCIEKLPFLGKEKMQSAFDFYNAFDEQAQIIREWPRFGGCISTLSNENFVGQLIGTCEKHLEAFEKYN